MANPKPFGIRIKYGGYFMPSGKYCEKYIGGQMSEIPIGLDPDCFGYFELLEELKKLGIDSWTRLSFMKPWSVTQVDIKDDAEVTQMLSLLSQVRTQICDVFVVGGKKGGTGLYASGSGCGRQGVAEESVGVEVVKQRVVETETVRKETLNTTKSKKQTVTKRASVANKGKKQVETQKTVESPLTNPSTLTVPNIDQSVEASPSASVALGARLDESVCELITGDDYGGLFDESEDDMSYIASAEEEETDDEMEAEELVSEDEEYIQGRKKTKERKKKRFVITDDMLLGIVNGGLRSDYVSEYENSEEDNIYSDSTDCQDEGRRTRERHVKVLYDPRCDHKNLNLCIGMGFTDGFQARDALTDNAVLNGWEIHFKRANKKQFEAGCKDPCPWKCSGSLVKEIGSVVVKKLEGKHTCPRAMRNKIVTSNWIARKYLHVFRLKPDLSCKDLGKDLMERYAFDATKWRLYHSKRKAIEMLMGTV